MSAESLDCERVESPGGGICLEPAGGPSVALMKCRAFSDPSPGGRETGRIHLRSTGIQALGDLPRERLSFDRKVLANDPTIRGMSWNR